MLAYRDNRVVSGRAGFTLIELMIVIAVIALLMGILLPLLSNVKKQGRVAASTSLMGSISQALQQYFNEHNMYPPSGSYDSSGVVAPYNGVIPIQHGPCMLAQGLLGYLPFNVDGCGPTLQNGSDSVNPNDPLHGFRLTPGGNGRIYGPYIQPQPGKTSRITASNPPGGTVRCQYFIDAFGNAIYYFRANSTSNLEEFVFGGVSDNARKISFFSGQENNCFHTVQKINGVDAAVAVANGNAVGTTSGTPASDKSALALATPDFHKLLGMSGNRKKKTGSTGYLEPNDLVEENKKPRLDNPSTMLLGKDSFLLISAGPDGMYFNKDDIVVSKP